MYDHVVHEYLLMNMLMTV